MVTVPSIIVRGWKGEGLNKPLDVNEREKVGLCMACIPIHRRVDIDFEQGREGDRVGYVRTVREFFEVFLRVFLEGGTFFCFRRGCDEFLSGGLIFDEGVGVGCLMRNEILCL